MSFLFLKIKNIGSLEEEKESVHKIFSYILKYWKKDVKNLTIIR